MGTWCSVLYNFRGKFILKKTFWTWQSVLNTEVSLFQGCLLSGIPLYSLQGKSVPVLCLEGSVQLLHTVVGRFPGRTEAFLSSVNSALQESASTAEKVHFFLKFFQVGMGMSTRWD